MSLAHINFRFSTLVITLLMIAATSFASPQIEIVKVNGGCFQMGDTFADGGKEEKPVHEVCVGDFYIGKYEVTQAQWKGVMGNNPVKFTGDKRPVESVSWYTVQTFIGKLNSMTGKQYRLPTEAEWEYAARSGGKEDKWAGTSDPVKLNEYAWYEDNSQKKSYAVGTRKPNNLGIYDMSGNVFEWCQDIFSKGWYGKSERDNPLGPPKGPERVIRGGGWFNSAGAVRATSRFGKSTDYKDANIGFRLVLPANTVTSSDIGKKPPSKRPSKKLGTEHDKAAIVSDAYYIIYNHYLIPVDSVSLAISAIRGMQGFAGIGNLMYMREGNGISVSSRDQRLKIEDVSTKSLGVSQISQIYTFVATANPQLDKTGLAYAAIKGMIGLDDNSELMVPEYYSKMKKLTVNNSEVGTGLRITKRNGRILVLSCIKQSPAFRAGILSNDEVIMIGDTLAKNISIQEASALLRGENNTEIKITIKREKTNKTLDFKLMAEPVTNNSIDYKLLNGNFTYIHINSFTEKIFTDFDKAIKELEELSCKQLKGILIDLRNSPGGLLSSVVNLTDRFLTSGRILKLKGNVPMDFPVTKHNDKLNYPVVVLVNENTFAGSEMMAGVLQDHNRALIVGTGTAGKGSVQTIIPLSDDSGLSLTTALSILPSGRMFDKVGIQPDLDLGKIDSVYEPSDEGVRDTAIGIATQILSNTASASKNDLMLAAKEIARKRQLQQER